MLFLGHIAASLLIADGSRSDRYAAIAGNLVPDVVDKTGSWVFHVMPPRWLAHGLPFFALMALASRLVLKGPSWRGFVLGYAGHLVCDLWGGGRVPWFAPFGTQKWRRRKKTRGQWGVYLVPELVGAGIIAWLANRPRESRP